MPQFYGKPVLSYPIETVFARGVELANWPRAVEQLNVRSTQDADRLSLNGLLTVSLHTPIRDLNLKAKVTEFVPNERIAVESSTRLARVVVGLGFYALGNQTQVQYDIGVLMGRPFGMAFEPFINQRGQEVVNEFVDEFVANVSTACAQSNGRLTA